MKASPSDAKTSRHDSEEASGLIQFTVDGSLITTLEGRSVAGALHAAGIRGWRRNPVTGETRAPFCGMGVCFECELTIDQVPDMRACLVPVRPGMSVRTQVGAEAGEVSK